MKKVRLSTNHGDIVIALDDENAPATVANFLAYVNDRHYDNTLFHRVIDGFMIQGGGFAPGMQQKPTRAPVANEAANGVKNARYTVFGKVVEGMDVVNKIAKTPTGRGGPFPTDVPQTRVVIKSAKVIG